VSPPEPLTITRKGGKVVAIPLAPGTARAIELATGERCDGPSMNSFPPHTQHKGAALDYSAFERAVLMLAVRLADGRNWDDADREGWTDGMAGG
jgi:hypothetical protein